MDMSDEDYDLEEAYNDAVEEAEACEEMAAEFPEDSGYLLLDAAQAWLRAGHRDRAVAVLRPVAAGHDTEAGYALVELADIALMEPAARCAGRAGRCRITTAPQRVVSRSVDPRDVERLCRAMAECGVPRIEIVAADEAAVAWPPPRNAPCWCDRRGRTRSAVGPLPISGSGRR